MIDGIGTRVDTDGLHLVMSLLAIAGGQQFRVSELTACLVIRKYAKPGRERRWIPVLVVFGNLNVSHRGREAVAERIDLL
jgi:hypothetical protein